MKRVCCAWGVTSWSSIPARRSPLRSIGNRAPSVRLITGTVRAKVAKRKKGQTFDVRTLMLVATVKGTEFEVSATAKASAVSVYEGRVAVKAAARVGGVDVTPGKTATVTGGRRASPTLERRHQAEQPPQPNASAATPRSPRLRLRRLILTMMAAARIGIAMSPPLAEGRQETTQLGQWLGWRIGQRRRGGEAAEDGERRRGWRRRRRRRGRRRWRGR